MDELQELELRPKDFPENFIKVEMEKPLVVKSTKGGIEFLKRVLHVMREMGRMIEDAHEAAQNAFVPVDMLPFGISLLVAARDAAVSVLHEKENLIKHLREVIREQGVRLETAERYQPRISYSMSDSTDGSPTEKRFSGFFLDLAHLCEHYGVVHLQISPGANWFFSADAPPLFRVDGAYVMFGDGTKQSAEQLPVPVEVPDRPVGPAAPATE